MSDNDAMQDMSLASMIETLHSRRFQWKALTQRQKMILRYFWACETEHDYAADLEELSGAWWDHDQEIEGPQCLLKQGYNMLVDHLVQGLDVQLEQHVSEIRANPDLEERSVSVTLKSSVVETCDYCICTVPLGVLKMNAIKFDPPLPLPKVEAIKRLDMATLNTVALRFSTCFWRTNTASDDIHRPAETSENHYFDVVPLEPNITSSEGPLPSYFFNMHAVTGANTVVAYYVGTAGKKSEALEDADLAEHSEKVFRRMFPQEQQQDSMLVEYARSAWANDPYSGGSYSYVPCGGWPEDYDALAAPTAGDRIFFAGEATNRQYPSTVHGALISGRRVARQLLKIFKAKK